MHEPTTTTSPGTTSAIWRRTAARWMLTFIGFPLGGLAASLLAGPVDSLRTALLGGLITGAILGTVQLWGFSPGRPAAAQWIVATGAGLMVGLAAGTAVVGYDTSLPALVVQGAICGVAVGAAQALVLRARLRRHALAWPPGLAVIWAVGWVVSTSIGIQVEDRFTVFGSSGAIVVTALTAVLPVVLNRGAAPAEENPS